MRPDEFEIQAMIDYLKQHRGRISELFEEFRRVSPEGVPPDVFWRVSAEAWMITRGKDVGNLLGTALLLGLFIAMYDAKAQITPPGSDN